MKLISKYSEDELIQVLAQDIIDSSDMIKVACKDLEIRMKVDKSVEAAMNTYKEYLKTKLFKKGLKDVFGVDLNAETLF